MESNRDKLWSQCKNTSLMSDVLGSFPDEPLLAVVDKALSYLRHLYRAYFGPNENAGQLQNFRLTSDVEECSDVQECSEVQKCSDVSELLAMDATSSMACIEKNSQNHLRSCATSFHSQYKNTSLMSEVLGPFSDEPLLTIVDKEVYYLCDLYRAYFGSKENAGQLQNSAFTSEECSDVPEPLFMNAISSTPFNDRSSADKPRCRATSICSSCPNLDTQLGKEYLMPQKKKRIVIPCRINAKNENRSWINAKVMRNGVKCFEIRTRTQEQNPSITLIFPPSGHVVPFECVPNDFQCT